MQSWQYIALLGAVIAVAAFLLPKGKNEKLGASSNAQMEQLELAFEQFMDNMENEHNDLVKMITTSLNQLKEEDRVKSEALARLEQRNMMLEEQLAKLLQQVAASEAKLQLLQANPNLSNHAVNERVEALEAANDEAEVVVPVNSIQSRYAELFEMYNSGKSVEVIAKKLGKNKGEIQLILQLAMQEEKSRYA